MPKRESGTRHRGIDLGGVGKTIVDDEQLECADAAAVGILQGKEAIQERVDEGFPRRSARSREDRVAPKIAGGERGQIGQLISLQARDKSTRRELRAYGQSRCVGHVVDHGSNLNSVGAEQEVKIEDQSAR